MSGNLSWYGQTLEPVDARYEVVKPALRGGVVFRVRTWSIGWKARHVPPDYVPKPTVAIALHVDQLQPKRGEKRWVFIGPQVVSQLVPILQEPLTMGNAIRVQLHGRHATAHWSVESIAT